MAFLEKTPCSCGGHTHCPKCGGSGVSDRYIVHHPICGKDGCRGTMHPTDHRPGAPLKCNLCGNIPRRSF